MTVADAFEHKAITELLKLILGLIQEVLRSRIFAGQALHIWLCQKVAEMGADLPQGIIHGGMGNESAGQALEKHCLRLE